jgi:oxalate decarboxylase
VALQYHIEGEARMGVFGASGQARTFDFRSGDVGYVPFAMGHYIDNMGTTSLRYLEIFKSSYYAEPTHGPSISSPPSNLQLAIGTLAEHGNLTNGYSARIAVV